MNRKVMFFLGCTFLATQAHATTPLEDILSFANLCLAFYFWKD